MVRWTPRGGSEPEMRASHDDRDRVADVLRVAAGDGYLSFDELDERLEAALSARTRAELAGLTADLPVGPTLDHRGAQAKAVVKIEQKHGSPVQRDGAWVLPQRIEVATKWVGVTLDLSEAVVTGSTLDVVLAMTGGDLVLVTRPGIVVDLDDLRTAHCHVRCREAPPAPGIPVTLRVRVSGRKKHGGVVVRPVTRTFGQWLRGQSPTPPAL
ncbi:MAG: DUF1707 domain-containing protein [Nocardioides sp.]|uniref:DUF1707 SHOCT-like domain-containing protein n=1 Tax=Nocardioides sp. TaxID=35761 RepID=UPI003F0C3251